MKSFFSRNLIKFEMEEILRHYTLFLGSGCQGSVTTGNIDPYDKIVAKFVFEDENPFNEFNINSKVYSFYKILKHLQEYQEIKIVKPIGFITEEQWSVILTERLISPLRDGIVQISLGEISSKEVTKVVNGELIKIKTEHGYFCDASAINYILRENNSTMTIDNICYNMGLLDSLCIFGAHVLPIDVEHVLVIHNGKLCVSLIDFGSAMEVNENGSNIRQYLECSEGGPVYNPNDIVSSDLYHVEYMKGFKIGYETFGNNNYSERIYDEIVAWYSS